MGKSDSVEIRLAARGTELTQLDRVFQEIRDGAATARGRLIMLSGAPGVGKTALAKAFLQRIKAVDPLAVTLTAVCVEAQTVYRPYGPFRDLLTDLRTTGAETGLAAVVNKDAPGWLPDSLPPASRNALFDQFVELCRVVARHRPLALLIDDLQWSDHSSLDLLGRLCGALSSLPILIIATNEEAPSLDGEGVRRVLHRARPNTVELTIRDLEKDAVLALAEELLDKPFATELGDWLVEASRGSPLRAEMYLRHLWEAGAIRKRLFRYQVAEDELPDPGEPIENLVMRRIEGIEPTLRWTLQAAALSGSVVDSAIVAGQMGKPEEEVISLLRAADDEHGLLAGLGDRRWPNGRWSVRFHFRHPLVRRKLREAVTEKRRHHLLNKAAEVQQRLAGDGAGDIADEILSLYLAANLEDRTHEWSLKAADLAERLYAVHEVEAFLRLAARTTEDRLVRLRIENRLAKLYSATGREPEAEGLVEDVYNQARELEDTPLEVSSGTMLGWLHMERGVPPLQLSEIAGNLVDRARQAELSSELVMALDLSCVVAERIGRAEEALLMAEEAMHIAELSGDHETLAQAAYRLARVHVSWGSPAEGRALAERALEVFDQMDELSGVSVCHDLLGLANFRAGDWDGALHHWESALESMEVAGVPDQKVAMQVNIAELLTLRGEFDRALGLLNSGLRLAEELDDQPLARRCRTGVARLEFERGDYSSVLERTEEIRKVLPESGAWKVDFQTTAIRALAYLELGDELQAWQEAARLEQLYQGKEGWFERRAEGDAVRIRVIDLDSDAWLAGTVAEQGIGETADKDPYGEGFLQYHRAHVLARAQPGDARQAAERAVELFRQLGAVPMYRRAQQLRDMLPTVEALAEEPDEGGGIDEDQIDNWFDSLEG